MNLATLKAAVAAYHEKTVSDLTKNDVDLFLVAANNARKNGEKLHTFEGTRCTAELDIDGVLGGQLKDAKINPPKTFERIKEVLGASVLRNNIWVPIDFSRADIIKERERSDLELDWRLGPENRYPSDSQFVWNQGFTKVVQRGNGLFLFPEYGSSCDGSNPPQELLRVKLECYGFLANYVAEDLTDEEEFDIFLQHGDAYLQWACIHELNYIFQTFVPRQEGNVIPSPKDMRDEAWRDFLLWDTYQVDSHITRTR